VRSAGSCTAICAIGGRSGILSAVDEPAPPTDRLRCKDHPSVPAVARCSACGRPLCDACFRFRIDGRPACARCAYEASTRPARRVSLGASFLCFAMGGGFWASRRYDLVAQNPFMLVMGGLAATVLAVGIAASGKKAKEEVENRDPDEEAAGYDVSQQTGIASPYRAQVRRVLLAASPQLSGSATALVVIASLAGSAVLLPASVKLPRWIEAEMVLGLWWLIVGVALTVLLYRGFRLRDDFVYFAPWDRPSAGADGGDKGAKDGGAAKGGAAKSAGSGWGLEGCGDAEGCAGGLVVAVALAAAFGAAWIFVELLMPLIFFLMYWLFMRAIGRVARDRRGCEGDLGKSLGSGALWATIYVAPIAALTWAIHALGRHP
jgi:hypothetical protein